MAERKTAAAAAEPAQAPALSMEDVLAQVKAEAAKLLEAAKAEAAAIISGAKAEAEADKPANPAEPKMRMVDFYAFRDGEKYKRDIRVGINGKTWIIKRGVHTQIPENVAAVLEASMIQNNAAVDYMEEKQREYENASNILE